MFLCLELGRLAAEPTSPRFTTDSYFSVLRNDMSQVNQTRAGGKGRGGACVTLPAVPFIVRRLTVTSES